ncbi:MAG: hypothetical protein ACI837_003096 [Crocinitomicaceae bacterium]|jgi:hypothetical protein
MKNILTACLVLLALSHFSSATGIKFEQKRIEKYERFQENIVVLPTDFARQFIIDKHDIELLSGKNIDHIDLVYTEFRESESFNQRRLNDQRIAQLKRLLPQVNADDPTWAWVEQTGAKTRDVANTYFHGFVIHYSDELDHESLQSFFSSHSKSMTTFTVTVEEGGTFNYPSGTKIHLPPNAVQYADGTPVTGSYSINYREFRDPAEIAFSGLPMTYEEGTEPANFSSVGMYEIRGSKDGKELELKKSAEIDFNCTKVVDDAAFFQMDDKNGEWKKLKDLDFNQAAPVKVLEGGNNIDPIEKAVVIPKILEHRALGTGTWLKTLTIGDLVTVWVDPITWKQYEAMKDDSDALFKKAIVEVDKEDQRFVTKSEYWDELNVALFGDVNFTPGKPIAAAPRPKIVAMLMNGNGAPNQMNSTLLKGRGPGHTYPTIVAGLNNPNFGVYNCDQVYRLASARNISPSYTDAATGEAINNKHVACVLDLTYNGSFSFQPSNLTCNSEGRNVVLLFTKNKKIYMLNEADFAKLDLDNGQKIDFKMTNVTSQLKSPNDLKKMINL